MSLIGPGVLGVGIVQVNTLVSSWFATYLSPGSVAYLFYADRLIQFPLGIVGVALGTALLPTLSVAVRSGRPGQGALQRAVELALLLGLPAGVGLLLLAEPIIAVLFERGAFDAAATKATAEVLAGLALGVPAQVLSRVLAAGFFALEDTRTPVRVALAALGVNIVAAAALFGPLAHVGIALASALSSWAGALGLGFLLRRRGLLVLDAALARRTGGILAAVIAMSLALGALLALAPELGLATLGGLIAAGATTFLVVALVAGGVEPGTWRWIWHDTRA
jgi:putative peptidoglycan lipid II flippase